MSINISQTPSQPSSTTAGPSPHGDFGRSPLEIRRLIYHAYLQHFVQEAEARESKDDSARGSSSTTSDEQGVDGSDNPHTSQILHDAADLELSYNHLQSFLQEAISESHMLGDQLTSNDLDKLDRERLARASADDTLRPTTSKQRVSTSKPSSHALALCRTSRILNEEIEEILISVLWSTEIVLSISRWSSQCIPNPYDILLVWGGRKSGLPTPAINYRLSIARGRINGTLIPCRIVPALARRLAAVHTVHLHIVDLDENHGIAVCHPSTTSMFIHQYSTQLTGLKTLKISAEPSIYSQLDGSEMHVMQERFRRLLTPFVRLPTVDEFYTELQVYGQYGFGFDIGDLLLAVPRILESQGRQNAFQFIPCGLHRSRLTKISET